MANSIKDAELNKYSTASLVCTPDSSRSPRPKSNPHRRWHRPLATSGRVALRLKSSPPLKRSRPLVALGQNQYPSLNVRDRW